MPELPEVEIVRRGLQRTVAGRALRALTVRETRLRWPVDPELAVRLAGRRLLTVDRRGKYLLLDFGSGWLLVHLGMSGTLTFLRESPEPRRHDHVDLVFDHGLLRYHDPRRFGAMLWHDAQQGAVADHPLLAGLGIEPFDPRFDGRWLHEGSRGRQVAIKQLLLAGGLVVGVGNIYASESLFRAGIRPGTPAARISRPRCDRLAQAIRHTLALAIERGGSSLRDFVSSAGEQGHFQLDALVYGRNGQPCRVCGEPVRLLRQQGRSTFWCRRCQR
jgi:formamidopyrimidine-DNA glycosylase